MRSACRGLGRKIPAPKRSISKREAPVAIISIAQHAKPNVIGHSADFLAQLKTKSTLVVMMFFSKRSSIHAGIYQSFCISVGPTPRCFCISVGISGPIQRAFFDNPDVSHYQNSKKHE